MQPADPQPVHARRNPGVLYSQESEDLTVAANRNLLKEVRRLAIKDELLAMRLRGRLVVVLAGSPRPQSKKPTPPEARK